jgi:hypothetical protein
MDDVAIIGTFPSLGDMISYLSPLDVTFRGP